jgi:ribose transport system substrate-binding protein
VSVIDKQARVRARAATACTLGVLGAAVVLSACGSSDKASSSASASTSSSDPYVAQAKATVAKLESATTRWDGPTTGPKIVPRKTVVYIGCAANNQICVQIGQSLKTVAPKIGWNVKVISGGQGTQQEITSAWSQAMALKPDGIINGATDATGNKASLAKAKQLGIPVVGILSTAKPGDASSVNEFANVSQDPAAIGRAEIQYAVTQSGGSARVVIQGIPGYAIAADKTDAMKAELAKCKACKLLTFAQTDLSTFQTDTAGLVSGWVSKYGPGFWVTSVADVLLGPMPGALRSGSVKPADVKLVASDGAPESYDRIRKGQYQVATFPQSPGQLSYQAVDELNRALAKQPPSGFAQPLHLVTKDNVDQAGGDHNEYAPDDGYQDQYMKIWLGK